MNNPNFIRIKNLLDDARIVGRIKERYHTLIRSSAVDKHDFSFGYPDKNLAAFQINFALNTYTGNYGNSSIYAVDFVGDNKAVENAFMRWANKNPDVILQGIARELELEACTLQEAARKEVELQIDYLDKLDELRNTGD